MKKLIFCVSIVLLISLFAIGCGKTSQPAQSAASSNAQNNTNTSSGKPSVNSDNLGAKLSAAYADMMKNKKYFMKYKATMNFEGQSAEAESSVAVSDSNMAVTTTANGIKSTVISKDGKTFMLNDAEKTVMELPQDMQKNTQQNNIETNGLTYVSSGTEDNLAYEKYSTTAGDIKYYFAGNKLVKIFVENQGQNLVMNIIEMSNNIPNSMFEIPSDYQKISLPN